MRLWPLPTHASLRQPLGVYIRGRLLGEHADKRCIVRKPKIDEEKIALILAELGRSRLSSSLNQLAKASNMGVLDVSQDTERELRDACRAVLSMRDALISALGLKPGNQSQAVFVFFKPQSSTYRKCPY